MLLVGFKPNIRKESGKSPSLLKITITGPAIFVTNSVDEEEAGVQGKLAQLCPLQFHFIQKSNSSSQINFSSLQPCLELTFDEQH